MTKDSDPKTTSERQQPSPSSSLDETSSSSDLTQEEPFHTPLSSASSSPHSLSIHSVPPDEDSPSSQFHTSFPSAVNKTMGYSPNESVDLAQALSDIDRFLSQTSSEKMEPPSSENSSENRSSSLSTSSSNSQKNMDSHLDDSDISSRKKEEFVEEKGKHSEKTPKIIDEEIVLRDVSDTFVVPKKGAEASVEVDTSDTFDVPKGGSDAPSGVDTSDTFDVPKGGSDAPSGVDTSDTFDVPKGGSDAPSGVDTSDTFDVPKGGSDAPSGVDTSDTFDVPKKSVGEIAEEEKIPSSVSAVEEEVSKSSLSWEGTTPPQDVQQNDESEILKTIGYSAENSVELAQALVQIEQSLEENEAEKESIITESTAITANPYFQQDVEMTQELTSDEEDNLNLASQESTAVGVNPLLFGENASSAPPSPSPQESQEPVDDFAQAFYAGNSSQYPLPEQQSFPSQVPTSQHYASSATPTPVPQPSSASPSSASFPSLEQQQSSYSYPPQSTPSASFPPLEQQQSSYTPASLQSTPPASFPPLEQQQSSYSYPPQSTSQASFPPLEQQQSSYSYPPQQSAHYPEEGPSVNGGDTFSSEVSDVEASSQEFDEQISFANEEMEDLGLPKETESRAIVALFLIPFFIFGPLVLILGWQAQRRITRFPMMFKGKLLALFDILVGAVESLGVLLLTAMIFFPSQNIPFLSEIKSFLPPFLVAQSGDFFPALDGQQKPFLKREQALALLQKYAKERLDGKLNIASLYVYQEPQQHYAFAYWFDADKKKFHRSLFEFSTEKQWHLALLDKDRAYETRCSQEAAPLLTANVARQLIQKFWQIRGHFSHVRVAEIYTYQNPSKHRAFAYWKLVKQMPGQQPQTWLIKTLFHYSNSGRWYLAKYAIPINDDVIYQYAAKGEPTLTKTLALKLLKRYHEEKQEAFRPKILYVSQKRGSRIAYAHWQATPKSPSRRSLFRYTNSKHWVLARLTVAHGGLLHFSRKGPEILTPEIAKELIQRYWKRKKHSIIFIRAYYIFQPNRGNVAYFRWYSHQRRRIGSRKAFRGRIYQSLFLRSNSGVWYLSRASTKARYDVRFSTQNASLNVAQAKEMIRRFWREDEQFAGARIVHLYLFKEKQHPNRVWAHWAMSRGSLITRMRTSFFLSNAKRWYLGSYNNGRGFLYQYSKDYFGQLTKQIATEILKSYLKEKESSSTLSKILSLYVFQPAGCHKAYVRWVREKQNQYTHVHSLFHRSLDGRWYLSTFQLHHLSFFQ